MGIIHTDFERGFIRAEVTSYDDYVEYGGENGAKEAGKQRLEGKDYIMKDIVHFPLMYNLIDFYRGWDISNCLNLLSYWQ